MNNAKQTKIIYAGLGVFFVAVIGVMLMTLTPQEIAPGPTIQPEKPLAEKPAEPQVKKTPKDPYKDLFSEDEPEAKIAPPPPPPVSTKQPRKAFILRLKGIIMSEKAYAFLVNSTTKEDYVCLVGEMAGDGWKVISIQESNAVVQKNQQKVRLGVDGSIRDVSGENAKKEYDVPELTSSGESEDLAATWFYRSPEDIKKRLAQLKNPVPDNDFEKKSPTRFVINEKTFRKLRGNLLAYGRDWVIAPAISEDKKKLEGIKIYGVNRFSIPYTYGARPGDIIKKINGVTINSPLAIFQLVAEYKNLIYRENETEYKIMVERLGKPVEFSFIVKAR